MLIFLTGFMCSGKTTDGKAAADNLNVPFFDLDEALEKRSGLPVWSFIEQRGIAEFRKLESEILLQTHQNLHNKLMENHCHTQKPEAVIATGGGSILMKENRDYLMQPQHCVVWLDLPFPLLLERIRFCQRPLLQGLSDTEILQLYRERLLFYQKACTHHLSGSSFTDQIVRLFTLQP